MSNTMLKTMEKLQGATFKNDFKVSVSKALNQINYNTASDCLIDMLEIESKRLSARCIFLSEIINHEIHQETDFMEWFKNDYLTKDQVVRKKYQKHYDQVRDEVQEQYHVTQIFRDNGVIDFDDVNANMVKKDKKVKLLK